MAILLQLESNLRNYWSQAETKKTWKDWYHWLQGKGCELAVLSDPKNPTHLINYQTFIQFLQTQSNLKSYPSWVQQLTSPVWLHSQGLVVLSTHEPHDPSMDVQQQMQHLIQEIQLLKQRAATLESQRLSSSMPAASLEKNAIKAPESPSLSPLKPPLQPPRITREQALMMEKELTLRQLSKPLKTEVVPSEPPPKQQPLEEIYLSYNDWCFQFVKSQLDLQPLSSQPLEVLSSHKISFRQFGHRTAKKVEDQNALRVKLEQFEAMYKTGFAPELGPLAETNPLRATDRAASGVSAEGFIPPKFTPPPEDMYQEYNAWLQWLHLQGVNAQNFTSQELEVTSSHRISFIQFCRRLERKLDNVERFRQAIGAS